MLLGSGAIALPPTSTFEHFEPTATEVTLKQSDAVQQFVTHTTFEIPSDVAARLGGLPLFNILHRFILQHHVARPLNQQLICLAQHSALLAQECDPHLVAGPLSDAGAFVTNRGGYQSYCDVFKSGSRRECSALRHLVNIAMTELDCESMYVGDESFLRPGPGELHEAYAWINLNRTSHSNTLHEHDPERWSGVYFVSDGLEPNAPNFADPHCESHSGRMIFRGGPTSSGAPNSHSYMAVPPLPGSLWLFSGCVAHAVLPTVLPPRGQEPKLARISVGINFSDARSAEPCPAAPSGLPPTRPDVSRTGPCSAVFALSGI